MSVVVTVLTTTDKTWSIADDCCLKLQLVHLIASGPQAAINSTAYKKQIHTLPVYAYHGSAKS